MKRILLLISLFVFTYAANSQTYTFGTYPNCVLPQGFDIGQGAQVRGYDNPNLNGCTDTEDDCGIETPGVGGNNPVNIRTPQLAYTPPAGSTVMVTFNIFIYDANLKCPAKDFPCATYVTGYVVDLSYNSNTTPTSSQYYGVSETQLVNANGVNLITINVTQTPPGPTRIYLDFSADCNQSNTKYIIDLITIPENIPLPVNFKSFSANRNRSNVDLTWVTATEQNNRGFDLQRSGAGGWQSIAFVPTNAKDGNSNGDISYQFTDANPSKGVSQYRIMQIDLNGKASYSQIRSVQGEGQSGRNIVAPNPSSNGMVNVIFESGNVKRDLQLMDMNGRMVKQWNGYADNSLQITDLTPGVYQLRILNRETGQQGMEKIMVTNR